MSAARRLSPALSFAALSAVAFIGASTLLQQRPAEAETAPDQRPPVVDYVGFETLTREAAAIRETRLVPLDDFNRIAAAQDAMILDTRSAADYASGHIDGAVNLPFSEFTDEKLAEVIGDKARPILIYCNNNFEDDVAPVMLKRAPLALNIPTFINLYGYGYQNIYELDELISMDDPRIAWVASDAPTPAAIVNVMEGQPQ